MQKLLSAKGCLTSDEEDTMSMDVNQHFALNRFINATFIICTQSFTQEMANKLFENIENLFKISLYSFRTLMHRSLKRNLFIVNKIAFA